MNRPQRIDVLFFGGGALAFVGFCLLVASLRMRLIGWYLGNCDGTHPCAAATVLIIYWWVPLIVLSLVGAYLLRRLYDAKRRSPGQRHP